MLHKTYLAQTINRLTNGQQRGDEYLEQLQAEMTGAVLVQGDPEYDVARRGWNLNVDQHPAVIALVQSAADVVAAVRYARQTGLGIAIQSTGHGVARAADDALLIVTAGLRNVQIDEGMATARVEAGAVWGDVLAKAQRAGLAPLLGSSPNVGVMGYTLGGGMGWLARKYGMALDSVLAFEVVTPDGRLVRASARENSELFWGLRGGGGALGIVTAMEINLYPVTTVYGGNLFYPASLAKAVLTRYRDWVQTLPDAMTTSVVLMNYPPIPAIPEPLRGQTMVIVRGCYAGDVAEGQRLIDEWRTWRAPQIDAFGVMPFSEVASISMDPVDPMPSQHTGAWLSGLSDDAIAALVRGGVPQDGPLPLVFIELRHAGGAIARHDSGAFSHRDGVFNLFINGVTPTPEARAAFTQHTDAIKAHLQPVMTGGVYLNFLAGEEVQQRTQAGFSAEAYARLIALKAALDPTNRLAYSYDIRPA
ncbi:MAG TPA: FAD-binding oxidoreductase [Chloroflexi bacterium]|nr:FAD-binding oxidoreductase [Chloroflexota bacterium]